MPDSFRFAQRGGQRAAVGHGHGGHDVTCAVLAGVTASLGIVPGMGMTLANDAGPRRRRPFRRLRRRRPISAGIDFGGGGHLAEAISAAGHFGGGGGLISAVYHFRRGLFPRRGHLLVGYFGGSHSAGGYFAGGHFGGGHLAVGISPRLFGGGHFSGGDFAGRRLRWRRLGGRNRLWGGGSLAVAVGSNGDAFGTQVGWNARPGDGGGGWGGRGGAWGAGRRLGRVGWLVGPVFCGLFRRFFSYVLCWTH